MALTELSAMTATRRASAGYAERDAGRTVIWLRGQHDICTVDTLSETLARAIAFDDGDLVLDMSAVEFMDASTVGVIARTGEFLRRRSRR